MTCQECELKLGMGEDAGEHMASCAECRGLAEELRLNSMAMGEMRVQPRVRWEWALAAAAAIVMAVSLWRTPKKLPEKVVAVKISRPVSQAHVEGPVAVKHVRRRPAKKREVLEPLQVKMFTSDPDVVIYWIVDQKEGSE